jgi:GntR family transcriptional regulator
MNKRSRVAESIIRRIETGALRAGDRLPSEEELAAKHGVSVGTIQKALAGLAHSGLISREHGRGTFVSGQSVGPADLRYLHFRDGAGHDLPTYVHVLSARSMVRKGPWSEFLGGEEFTRIARMINVGGHLELYSEFWLRKDDFAKLGDVNRRALEKNLRELLDRQLALPTLRVDQWIHFEPLPRPAAHELGLDPGQPGFVMELRGYTLRDRPLSYQIVYAGPFAERLAIIR